MPPQPETRLQLSVLDRLLDDEPRKREEAQVSRSQTVSRLKDALRRDIEWLLNTRAFSEEVPEELEQTAASVFTYGLPDFSALSASSRQTKARLERAILRAIETFEPRLFQLTVKAVESDGKGDRGILRFLITGWMRMEPAPLEISFDT